MSQTKTVVSFALAQIGKPYALGASGPEAFDCSGLVVAAAREAGVTKLPRTAKEQATYCETISRGDLSEGDLIFFDFNTPPQNVAHVGIYIGDGKMINAQSQSPAAVAEAAIDTGYWSQRVLGYGRIFSPASGAVAKRELVASTNTKTDAQPINAPKTKPKHVLM